MLFALRHFWKSALLIESYFRSANISDRYHHWLFLPLQCRVIRESGEGSVGGLILEDICTCHGCGTAGARIIQQAHSGAMPWGCSRLLPPSFCFCCHASSHNTHIHNEKWISWRWALYLLVCVWESLGFCVLRPWAGNHFQSQFTQLSFSPSLSSSLLSLISL